MTHAPLRIWIPSNRRYDDGSPKGMDSFNEIINANRSGRIVGSRMERENVMWCATYVRKAMADQGWPAMRDKASAVPCKVCLMFVEPNAMRDVPNVYGQSKFAIDALTARHSLGAGAIYDDSQRWLDRSVCMGVRVEPGRAGIEITVIALGDIQDALPIGGMR